MKRELIKMIETPVEPVCYGFAEDDPEPGDVVDGYWATQLQRPFRPEWLWLFGDPTAQLSSLKIGAGPKAEQLLEPLPFAMMWREWPTLEDFLKLVQHEGHQRKQLAAAPIHPVLCKSFGAPNIVLPAGNVGADLSFGYDGRVRAIVLVGVQVK